MPLFHPPAADATAAAPTDEAIQALNTAWEAATGTTMADDVARERLRRGWSPDRVAWLAGLAEHAVAVDAAVACVGRTRPVTVHAGFWLARAGDLALTSASECSFEALAGWLLVIASDPDHERSEALRRAVSNWSPYDGVGWRSRTGGPHAALTWAAGLRQQEAAERHAADTLEEAGLRMLAALRGFRLPAPE